MRRNANCRVSLADKGLQGWLIGLCVGIAASSTNNALAMPTLESANQSASLTARINVAQINPNPSIFNEPPFNRLPRPHTVPSDVTPNEPTQSPDAVMTPVNGKVNIRFVNETGAVIDYQVIGNTELLPLAGRSEMTLRDLPVPTSLTFRRQDKGFLQITLQANAPTKGTVTLTVRETADFKTDRTSLYVDKAGAIFLN